MTTKDASTDKQFDRSLHETVTVMGFGRRLLATFFDMLLMGFLVFVVMTAIGFLALLLAGFNPEDPTQVDGLIILSGLIVSIVYYVGSWAKSGRTIGKAVTGMKVVRTDGSPISWGQALLRYLGYFVSGVPLSLGFLWLAFDPKRQGWHDKIARTLVVEADATFDAASGVDFEPSDPGRNWIWLIIWVFLVFSMPGALLTSLWIFGPVISRYFTDFLSSLR
jgi:uncharacterized RDD family membrane protein YckC